MNPIYKDWLSGQAKMIYLITAYRWGDKEKHSYIVGVFDDKTHAIKMAEQEEQRRGGKYKCEVVGWEVNGIERDILKPLPWRE